MDDKDRDEAKKLCERLDWMKINGKNDLVQWENVLSYEIARIRAEAVAAERERSDSIVIDRVLTAEPESCEGASSRDKKGMRVRQIWMAWAQEQPNPKPSWLMPWKDLDEPSREVDRRIGCGLWGDGFAAGLDAFFKADSLVQDARDDERRRCAECCIKILKLAREKIQDHVNEIYSSGGVEYLGLGSTLDGIDKVLKELESNG